MDWSGTPTSQRKLTLLARPGYVPVRVSKERRFEPLACRDAIQILAKRSVIVSFEIPVLSVPDINESSNYIPFRNTSAYLKAKSTSFKDTHELLALCGYSRKSSYGKFLRHQSEWNSLKRNIPLKYLLVIGADLQEIDAAVQADRQEYESILKLPFFPKSGVIRCMAAVYSQYKFEPLTPEAECIDILKAYSKEKGFRTCINYPRIKSIWVEPSGTVRKSYYYPTLTLTKTELIPSYTGEGIGTVFIK
jgi:hypothetical protein